MHCKVWPGSAFEISAKRGGRPGEAVCHRTAGRCVREACEVAEEDGGNAHHEELQAAHGVCV